MPVAGRREGRTGRGRREKKEHILASQNQHSVIFCFSNIDENEHPCKYRPKRVIEYKERME